MEPNKVKDIKLLYKASGFKNNSLLINKNLLIYQLIKIFIFLKLMVGLCQHKYTQK